MRCVRCGAYLLGDPDEDVQADGVGPLCGECQRNRNFEADIAMLDAADGDIDGHIDL